MENTGNSPEVTVFSGCIRFGFTVLLKVVYRLKVLGLEKVPPRGKLIIACNHCSNIDPPVVDVSIRSLRPVRVVAKKELFENFLVSRVLREIKAIRVDRKKAGGDLAALRHMLDAIESGDCVVVFPEGTREKEGVPLPPKSGIGFLACKSGAPVVTARIFGTKEFPFARGIKMVIGKTLKWSDVFNKETDLKTAYSEFSSRVMDEIFSITEEDAQRRSAC